MRARIVFLIVCGVIGAVVIAAAAYTKRETQPPEGAAADTKRGTQPPQEAAPSSSNSIESRVARAKAAGKTEIVISAPHTEYTGSSASTDLDKALSYYTAVVARPVKMQSYIAENGEDVVTWLRFKEVEVLSENEKPACPACPVPTPPEEFSQVKKDEFVAVKIGGTVAVDGINVTMTDPSFPDFHPGKKYLLFISKYPSGVATLGIGPKGIFTVDDLGDVKGVNQDQHAVKRDIEGRFNHSLLNLKLHAQSFRKKP